MMMPMPPHPITHRCRAVRAGFSMIELAIVVVLVGIVSAMAVTGWNRLTWHVRALGAAQEFRDAVLLARSDAVTRKRHSGILIDPDGMRYLRFLND